MPAADEECFVYVVLPGQTHFVTAGRFALRRDRRGGAVGAFVYGQRYRERLDALPDFWGRQVIERKAGWSELTCL